MRQDGKPMLVCEAGAVAPADVRAVDALCRLALIAQRLGLGIRIEHPTDELRALVLLAGLDEVLGCDPPSGVEPER